MQQAAIRDEVKYIFSHRHSAETYQFWHIKGGRLSRIRQVFSNLTLLLYGTYGTGRARRGFVRTSAFLPCLLLIFKGKILKIET